MIDTASGGSLVDKTPQAAWELISTMAANSQQFETRNDPPRHVHEVSNSSIEQKLNQLTSLVHNLVVGGGPQQVHACGICADYNIPRMHAPLSKTILMSKQDR